MSNPAQNSIATQLNVRNSGSLSASPSRIRPNRLAASQARKPMAATLATEKAVNDVVAYINTLK